MLEQNTEDEMERSPIVKKVFFVAVVLDVILISFFFLAFFPFGGEKTVEMEIKEGSNILSIADSLKEKGVIKSKYIFCALAFLGGKAKKLQAGWYEFTLPTSTFEVLRQIYLGKVKGVKVTIPEGFTVRDIARRLEEKGLISEEEFLTLATNAPSSLRAIVNAPNPNLEGFLFPDTYIFPKGIKGEEIIKAMLENFRRKAMEKIRGGPLPFYQTLILASMVEKEAKYDDERDLIAGVLLNRLEKDLKLECDATVQYALPAPKERLTYEDLKVVSPYNTYLHKGLPPTPICNPGLSSILSAVHPRKSPYLFYVARPDGRHIFSRTLQEHLSAIEKARNLWQGGDI